MRSIKESGSAKDLRICITCWQLIAYEESESQHQKHYLTGSFAQMAVCTAHTFQALCSSKSKTQSSNEGQKLLLFSQSSGFQKKVQQLVAQNEPISLPVTKPKEPVVS